jgi:hypothetical protein
VGRGGAGTVRLSAVSKSICCSGSSAVAANARVRGRENRNGGVGEPEARVDRLQDLGPRVVGSGLVAARSVDDVQPGQFIQADGAAVLSGPSEKSCRKNWNTFSASRKIDAAISGAEPVSDEPRSRWNRTWSGLRRPH